MDARHFFATVPRGMEALLVEELRALGAAEATETRAGVSFRGDLQTAYRACLWSRLASRVLLPLAVFPAATAEELYACVYAIPWEEHLTPEGTLAVDATVSASAMTHSQFAALKTKDAIVDRFRDRCGRRPSVAVQRPDLRINLHLHRDTATVGLDLSGESLHRRGYRLEGTAAPMKENLAAAVLLRAGWAETAAAGGAFVDPMCGSGTLPIEAALLAADVAPGLLREYFGFQGWLGHDAALWEQLLEEARERRAAGLPRLPAIVGYDADALAVRNAWANLERAGLAGAVHFERRDVAELVPAPGAHAGLVVINPPYGERLGEVEQLRPLYRTIGERLRSSFGGWKAAVLTANPDLGKEMGLRARRLHTLFNGALECRLLLFDVEPQWFVAAGPRAPRLGEGAQMLANRLRKNLQKFGRWARQNDISCYRLYDADLPEYAVAVDIYERWVHVQEYEAPASVDPEKAALRLREALAVIPIVLEVPETNVLLKVRRRQKGKSQYEKQGETGVEHEVREGGLRFLVNLTDFLDTGLFLDHRPTRQMLREMAAGKRFLNLFAYTGTATVYAAAGGAGETVSVDLSRTYLDWARRNLTLNGITGRQHQLVQADVLAWMAKERRRFDLVFLDPPTFSSSKRMEATFDVQRDHVPLLRAASRLLTPGGTLVFSTNSRRFRLDREELDGLDIRDITPRTIPPDFERNPRIHHCWLIRLRS